MLRNLAQPGHAGGFEPDVGVEAAGHGAVDDGLLLFVQQRDQLFLRPDVALDPTVGVVEEADDGILLIMGRFRKRLALQKLHWNPHPVSHDAVTNPDQTFLERLGLEHSVQISRNIRLRAPSEYIINRAQTTHVAGQSHRTDYDVHAVNYDVVRLNNL